jgi:RNA polymerase sigma factor for flagellar operon FliA
MLETGTAPASCSTPAPRRRQKEALEEYLPLVWKVARQIARRIPAHIDANELIGAGTLGLCSALERYDASRCDRFAGYAEIRIRGAILDQLREMDSMPRWARTKRKRLEAATTHLHNTLGRAPDPSELAGALGMTPVQMDRMRVDIDRADVRGGVDLDDCMSTVQGPEVALERRESRARLVAAIDKLSPRQQQLLSLYYGDHLKLRELGEIFGVTESRVCQIHSQVVAQLRHAVLDA